MQDEMIDMERKYNGILKEMEMVEEVLEKERLNISTIQAVSTSI